jgi:hypothetical protein
MTEEQERIKKLEEQVATLLLHIERLQRRVDSASLKITYSLGRTDDDY